MPQPLLVSPNRECPPSAQRPTPQSKRHSLKSRQCKHTDATEPMGTLVGLALTGRTGGGGCDARLSWYGYGDCTNVCWAHVRARLSRRSVASAGRHVWDPACRLQHRASHVQHRHARVLLVIGIASGIGTERGGQLGHGTQLLYFCATLQAG